MDEDAIRELDRLRTNYRSKMVSKVYELEGEWQKYLRFNHENEFNEVYRITHNLSGTAGTYGYPGVGQLCRALVLYLDECMEQLTDLCQQTVSHRIETLIILACLEPCEPLLGGREIEEPVDTQWKKHKGHEALASFV